MKRFRNVIFSSLVILALSLSSLVYAKGDGLKQNANDLFELYNKALLDEYTKLQDEYKTALEAYEKEAQNVQDSETYNQLYKTAEAYQKQKLKEIDSKISDLMDDNAVISDQVAEQILGDWDSLLKLDGQYKVNLNRITELLNEKEKYVLSDKREISYDTLDELGKEIEELEIQYEASVDVAVLGDVDNVKFPLGAPTVVTSKFGDRVDPMTGTSIRFHAGIDLRAAIGTEVLSLFNGIVTDTGYGAAGGYYVTVNHGNGIKSYYCHLSEITCEVGQRVSQYDVIALSGNTGKRTTGPHLHLGLYIDGNPVDPGIVLRCN